MSYIFPRYRPRAFYVIDYEDWNAIFVDIASELGGKLNEHNFGRNAFTSRLTTYENDAVFRTFQASKDDAETHTDTIGANTTLVTLDGQWHTLQVITVTGSPGGILWCNASASIDSVGGSNSGLIYAIRIDNTLLPETMTGTAEFEQDRNAPMYGGSEGDSTPSVLWGHAGVVLDALVPVDPGEHVVELVVLRYPIVPAGAWANNYVYVKSNELVVVEMAR